MKKKFTVKKVSYNINQGRLLSCERREIIVTPILEIDSDLKTTLIAFLTVDNHEMIPSARIPLLEGKNSLSMKSIKIIIPSNIPDKKFNYNMRFFISPEGDEYDVYESVISIS